MRNTYEHAHRQKVPVKGGLTLLAPEVGGGMGGGTLYRGGIFLVRTLER